MRHGHAVDVGVTGVPSDADRFLTAEGRRKIAGTAAFLKKKVAGAARIYSSPLVRALESSNIIRDVMGVRRRVIETDFLSPGEWNMDGVVRQLKGDVCVIVGHNPGLEELASEILAGKGTCFMKLKKAGVCWISFDGNPRSGAGVMRCLLSPVDFPQR